MLEPINEHHLVENFDCGRPLLNDWLIQRALSNHRKGFTSVVVAHEQYKVIGYYGLSPTAVYAATLPRSIRTGQPPDPLPCILLGRLAVDLSQQGQGLGTVLLTHALQRAVRGAKLIGGRAILVSALDEEANSFWKSKGFTATQDDPFTLFMAMAEVEKTLDRLG